MPLGHTLSPQFPTENKIIGMQKGPQVLQAIRKLNILRPLVRLVGAFF